jgi:cystathionine beta-lyase
MSKSDPLNRRAFLRNVPISAFAGAALAAEAGNAEAGGSGKHDFDTPYSRLGTDSIKWDRQIRIYGKEHIAVGMGIADMDFRAAPCITKALTERIQHENWGYLDTPRSFIDAIVNWNKRRYGITVNPDLLLLNTGVHPGIIAALRTFSPPGSKVLMMTPIYDGFYGDISFCGCTPEEIPMKVVNGRYSMDFEALEHRINHDTNTLILCNPHNPTGNCWSREDMTTLGEICTRRRVVVLADEIHCDFVTNGNKYTPYCTLDNKEIVRNSITFKAASKSFSLAAMKCAWLFSENPDYIARVRANNRQDFSTLGMIANRAALTEGQEWLDELLPYIDANHAFVDSFIRERMPLVKTVKPQGTYLSWLDVSRLEEKIGAKEMAVEANKKVVAPGKPVTPEMIVERWLVENAKVQVNPGSAYGLGGAGHMRMNIATSRKTLELALTNMASTMAKL